VKHVSLWSEEIVQLLVGASEMDLALKKSTCHKKLFFTSTTRRMPSPSERFTSCFCVRAKHFLVHNRARAPAALLQTGCCDCPVFIFLTWNWNSQRQEVIRNASAAQCQVFPAALTFEPKAKRKIAERKRFNV